MADAARLDANQYFAGAGLGNIALHDLKREVRRPGYGGSDLHWLYSFSIRRGSTRRFARSFGRYRIA
jgi:hypothetical protein